MHKTLLIGHSRKKVSALFFAMILTFVFLSTDSPAEAACEYPSQVLNLANWKETLPTGSSGSPTEIILASSASYSMSPYFHVNSTCNGVVFRAPVNGVTTSGSSYPRSELREMTSNGQTKASWSTTSGTNTMFIDQAITAVPKTKKHVVAGQIHDADDDVIVVRLEYPKLFIDINGNDGPVLDANYTLGKRFTVKFVSSGGKINIYYNGASTPAYTLSKSGSGHYFKAGAYTQSNCSKESDCSSNNYGEVVIYNLALNGQTVTPAPAPTPVPTPTPTPIPVPTPAPIVSGLSFEAESGTLTAPMKIVDNSVASNGKYVVQNTDTGTGSIKYTFSVSVAGQYQLRSKVIAPNGSSNSVYYILDNSSSNTLNFPDNLSNWTWANGPTLNLSEGTHTLIIKKRESNTQLDAFEFKPAITLASSPAPSTTSDSTAPFEAESGIVSGGMNISSDDSSASGQKYIKANSSGTVTYSVSVPTSGTYRLAGWIKAPTASADSFYASIDGNSSSTWTLNQSASAWLYDIHDGTTFSLSAGAHTLTIKYREAGAQIDKLVLVKQ